jgi:5-(carboxyamino)imidazole ribonucleotide synthase
MKITKIGVIGGGQLAWMMAQAAPELGLELVIQTPSKQDPAVNRVKQTVLASIDDVAATSKLAESCDVITFENEFIDLAGLKSLVDRGVCFRPSLQSLAPLLDKYDQRSYLQKIGLPVPNYFIPESIEQISTLKDFPLVIKARRHGYDGKGTFIVKDATQLEKVLAVVPLSDILVEEFIPFDRELAVIAARNLQGDLVIYPVVETYQKQQVCHWTIAPANISDSVSTEIEAIASTLLTKLEYIGVLGIEFFLTSEGKVLVNEIAPRTHNSGHYTLDASLTSQFAMQLQAVADLPLSSVDLKSAGAIMVNLLGYEDFESDYQGKRAKLAAFPNAYVHWYGKTQSRIGRKLGHVTVLLDSTQLSQARSIAEEIERMWYGSTIDN